MGAIISWCQLFGHDIIFILDNTFLLCLYHLHLNREEGTVSTAFRNCGSEGSACGWRCNAPPISGSFGRDPRLLRTERLRWLNNLSGKPTGARTGQPRNARAPCDLGLCKNDLKAKIAASKVRGFMPFLFKKLFHRQGATLGHSPPFFSAG